MTPLVVVESFEFAVESVAAPLDSSRCWTIAKPLDQTCSASVAGGAEVLALP